MESIKSMAVGWQLADVSPPHVGRLCLLFVGWFLARVKVSNFDNTTLLIKNYRNFVKKSAIVRTKIELLHF